jgi:hypothetical protein
MDPAAGVAEDGDRPFGRAGVCPDVAAGPVFPLPGLPVPLAQAASSITSAAAVTSAEPRRFGHM